MTELDHRISQVRHALSRIVQFYLHAQAFIQEQNEWKSTQPSIHPGSVKWKQTSAGKAKVYFIPFVDKRVGVQVTPWDPLQRVPYLSASVMRLRHKEALYQFPITFNFTVDVSLAIVTDATDIVKKVHYSNKLVHSFVKHSVFQPHV